MSGPFVIFIFNVVQLLDFLVSIQKLQQTHNHTNRQICLHMCVHVVLHIQVVCRNNHTEYKTHHTCCKDQQFINNSTTPNLSFVSACHTHAHMHVRTHTTHTHTHTKQRTFLWSLFNDIHPLLYFQRWLFLVHHYCH